MTTLENITACIKTYGERYKDMTPDDLLNCKDKIVTQLFLFAEDVSTAYEEYLNAKLTRKMGIIESMENSIAGGFKKGEAELKAEKDCRKLYEEENKWESNFRRYKTLLEQSNEVVSAISQRVSQLKVELRNSKNETPYQGLHDGSRV